MGIAARERSDREAHMAPWILFKLHVLILREHMAWLGFVSRLQPPFPKRKYVGYPNLWLSSERGFASKPKIITYCNSRTSGLDAFGEMCTTNRLPPTGYMQRRFCFVIHLNVAILQRFISASAVFQSIYAECRIQAITINNRPVCQNKSAVN